MKTYFSNELLLCAVTLTILGPAASQAQLGGVPLWTNRYGPATVSALAVDSSGNVFMTGNSYPTLYPTDPGADYLTIKYSGAGVPLWTNRYNGAGNGDDLPSCIAVDSNGDVVVTGGSIGTNGLSDYATIKYSGSGVPLWTNRYHGAGSGGEGAAAIAVDSSGNVFVTGGSTGLASSYDYATIKYSGAGVPLWTNRYTGPGNGDGGPSALAVDGSGNVFVTGSSTGSVGDLDYDYATIKYSGAGVPLWTNRYNGPGNGADVPWRIAVDSSGSVFVTGTSTGSGSGYDYATIKYSGAGVPLWTNRYNGPGNTNDYATSMAVDSSGNVLVTGQSTASGGAYDYATIKYSAAGVPLWTNRYNGPASSDDTAAAVAVDDSGNVFVTGGSTGRGGLTDGGGLDYATIAYSSAGTALWTNRYDGPNGRDQAVAMAVDASGNVFVTGASWNVGDENEYATIKYSSSTPPSLTIALTPTNTVAVSWPSPSTGFMLQQNTHALVAANWSNVLATPSDDGTTKVFIVDPPMGNRFYRLVHP